MEQDLNDTIELELEKLGCNPQWRGRYWFINCPMHEDRHKSAQCFPDGWIHCNAGCPRTHINKLVGRKVIDGSSATMNYERQKKEEIKRGDFTNLWADLEPLDPNLDVKGVKGNTLNKLGWRWYPGGNGYHEGIFIPYFDTGRERVPFFQIRHLTGDRRFTFATGITPILWGFDVLPKVKNDLCFTEGTRDAAILRSIGVPAVALPSASSTKILNNLADYCQNNKIRLIATCDNDEAGKTLLKALRTPYTALLSPEGKDIGDLLEKRGIDAVKSFYGHLQISEELV